MLLIGDVLAAIGMVLATAGTLWALLVAIALLFAARAQAARERLEARPLRTLAGGATLSVTAGLLAFLLATQGSGLIKLIGWVLLLGLLGVASVGASGLTLLLSERVRANAPRLSPLAALGRAAGLQIAASYLPVLGWFVVFPLSILIALGAGTTALWPPRRRPVSLPAAPAAAAEVAGP